MNKPNFSNLIMTVAAIWRCSLKNLFLKISQNSEKNTSAEFSFLIELQAIFIQKEASAQVFSCEFWEII